MFALGFRAIDSCYPVNCDIAGLTPAHMGPWNPYGIITFLGDDPNIFPPPAPGLFSYGSSSRALTPTISSREVKMAEKSFLPFPAARAISNNCRTVPPITIGTL